MQKIFISYRRQDSKWSSRSIFDRLEREFGVENIFFDVDMIPGVDFITTIKDSISNCDVVLVIIGNGWISEIKRRSRSTDDFVRIEIENAIITNRTIIPVLVDEAIMPNEKQLPFSIKALCRRNASTISAGKFGTDMHKLSASINKAFADTEKRLAEEAANDERRRQLAEQEIARIALEAHRKSQAGEARSDTDKNQEKKEPKFASKSISKQTTSTHSNTAILRHRRKHSNFNSFLQFSYFPNRFLLSEKSFALAFIIFIVFLLIALLAIFEGETV